MRLSQRLIAATVLIALSGALAGCGGGGISSWDPSDMLDWLDTKKKLKAIASRFSPKAFPASSRACQRICTRGARAGSAERAGSRRAAPPPEEPKQAAKKGSQKKPPAAAARPAADPNAAPDADASGEAAGDTAAAPPAPKPKKIVRKRTTAPPPDQQDAQPASAAPRRPPPRNNNLPRHSRRRCRAILSRADLFFIALTPAAMP